MASTTQKKAKFISKKLEFLKDERDSLINAVELYISGIITAGESWAESGGDKLEYTELCHMIETAVEFLCGKCEELTGPESYPSFAKMASANQWKATFISQKLKFLKDQRDDLISDVELYVSRIMTAGEAWIEGRDINIEYQELNQMIDNAVEFLCEKCQELAGRSVDVGGNQFSQPSSEQKNIATQVITGTTSSSATSYRQTTIPLASTSTASYNQPAVSVQPRDSPMNDLKTRLKPFKADSESRMKQFQKQAEKGEVKNRTESGDQKRKLSQGRPSSQVEKGEAKNRTESGDQKRKLSQGRPSSQVEKGEAKNRTESGDQKRKLSQGRPSSQVEKGEAKSRTESGDRQPIPLTHAPKLSLGSSSTQAEKGKSKVRWLSPTSTAMGWNKLSAGKVSKKNVNDISKPKLSTSAYIYFLAKCRKEATLAGKPPTNMAEFAQITLEEWKELSVDKKKPFEVAAAADRKRYEVEMAVYKEMSVDPNKPKRPTPAYFLFLTEFRTKMANKRIKYKELQKIAGEVWRSMGNKDRKRYKKQASDESNKYRAAVVEYRRTGGGACGGMPVFKKVRRMDEDEEDDEEDDDNE